MLGMGGGPDAGLPQSPELSFPYQLCLCSVGQEQRRESSFLGIGLLSPGKQMYKPQPNGLFLFHFLSRDNISYGNVPQLLFLLAFAPY